MTDPQGPSAPLDISEAEIAEQVSKPWNASLELTPYVVALRSALTTAQQERDEWKSHTLQFQRDAEIRLEQRDQWRDKADVHSMERDSFKMRAAAAEAQLAALKKTPNCPVCWTACSYCLAHEDDLPLTPQETP